jgi:hypothetical protein
MSRSAQIAALGRLWGIFHFTLKFCPPNVFEDLTKKERMQLYREAIANAWSVEDARHELLKSGYPAPDRWLTVQVCGELSRERTKTTDVIRLASVDRDALRQVRDEMKAALMRLKAGVEPSNASGANGSNDTEENIVEALRAHGRAMKGAPLGVAAVGKFNSNVKAALASMVKRKILTNNRDGYSLAEWNARS